jgi:hypothetical protein
MDRLRSKAFLVVFLAAAAVAFFLPHSNAQSAGSPPQVTPAPAATQGTASQTPPTKVEQDPTPPVISPHAPHMSKQTRYEIIRDFETQMVYSRTVFPMGTKGLVLKDGTITPNGTDLQQSLALWGPAVRPGDPAQISFVRIKDDHIHFELNGGPVRRKKWYNHIEVSGTNGVPVTPGSNDAPTNPHGSYLDVYFDHYVPELTPQQLRSLLFPALDFNAKNKEQAYLDTVPPKVKQAILAHHVLVGMNSEMVVHSKGRPPKKDREKDGETEYEEWIYGDPPQDVDFVRIVDDTVVRIETMKVGGEKIVRTEKEVILEKPDKDTEAKEEHPANAPSLRRAGEDSDEAPRPAEGVNPAPPMPPPDIPQPPGNPGPGALVATR